MGPAEVQGVTNASDLEAVTPSQDVVQDHCRKPSSKSALSGDNTGMKPTFECLPAMI